MNNRMKVLLGVGALLFSSVACNAATKLIPQDKPAVTSVPIPSAQAIACPSTLNAIMTAASTPGEYTMARKETYLVTYDVAGENITNPVFQAAVPEFQSEQNDVQTQKQVWNYFTSLIPEQNRQMIKNYSILTDGKDNILAAVAQTRANPKNWVLEVDIADANDYGNLTFTMIHEFGHILTLNADQVPPDLNVFDN